MAELAFCESVRGEWGEICPDCGQRLPSKPGPLRSWQATRPLREGIAWDGSPIDNPGMSAAQRTRWAEGPRLAVVTPARGPKRPYMRLNRDAIAAALRLHRGNVNAAAIALGVQRQTVAYHLSYHRAEYPADLLALVDRRRRA